MKRGKLEIIRDILKIIKENKNYIKPTPLLRKSKVTSKRFKGYFSDMIEKGLIVETKTEDDNKFISLTDKGYQYLEKYNELINFIDRFDL